jgi:RsmE family RNA methyltransferase
MKNAHAFLVPSLELSKIDTGLTLDARSWDESFAKHFRALRIHAGERVCFLDGAGRKAFAICADPKKLGFDVESLETQAPSVPSIELCLAAPKGEALWEAVTQATEVGVTSLNLVEADHVQAPKKDAPFYARIQRVADAACEQCLQPWRVRAPRGWDSLEKLLSDKNFMHVVADEKLSAQGLYGFVQAPRLDISERVRLYVGPEGGWSQRERQVFGASAHAMGLGPFILRVPTAVVASVQQIRWLYASR